MHPREFVALYGLDFALDATGYNPDTFSKYIAKPGAKRGVEPNDAVKRYLGYLHFTIEEERKKNNATKTESPKPLSR